MLGKLPRRSSLIQHPLEYRFYRFFREPMSGALQLEPPRFRIQLEGTCQLHLKTGFGGVFYPLSHYSSTEEWLMI